MVQHPGPDREFAEWAKKLELRWIGVDCGSADHPMNTIIRQWMPRQAKQAEKVFKKKFGKSLEEFYGDDKYQLMHLEMFPYHVLHESALREKQRTQPPGWQDLTIATRCSFPERF